MASLSSRSILEESTVHPVRFSAAHQTMQKQSMIARSNRVRCGKSQFFCIENALSIIQAQLESVDIEIL